jgi:hypothetical protein
MPTFGALAASVSDGQQHTAQLSSALRLPSCSSLSPLPVRAVSASISSFAAPSSLEFSSAASAASDSASGLAEQFKERKAESSGEETDDIQLRIQSRVFILKTVQPDEANDGSDTAASSSSAAEEQTKPEAAGGEKAAGDKRAAKSGDRWVDVGTGELHVNTYRAGGEEGAVKARLIMRADRTHRLILNTPLLPHLQQSFAMQADRYVRLASVRTAAEDETAAGGAAGGSKLVQYLLRVKGKAEALEVLECLKRVVGMVKAD